MGFGDDVVVGIVEYIEVVAIDVVAALEVVGWLVDVGDVVGGVVPYAPVPPLPQMPPPQGGGVVTAGAAALVTVIV